MSEFDIDENAVRRLAALLKETGIAEIEYRDGDRRLRLVAVPASATAPPPSAVPTATVPPAGDGDPSPAQDGTPVTAPMVGTVYLQPEPGQPPFVRIGDSVQMGDTLLIVEAMKVFNQIPSPADGIVRRILVETGQPVEYGEILMILE